jgi:hypothetical protein
MRKLLTRSLLGVAALAIPAGTAVAMTGTAFAATGAPKTPIYSVDYTTMNSQTGPTAVGTDIPAELPNSFVINTLDSTTGNLTTTVKLQGAAPNTQYYANVSADGIMPGILYPLGYSGSILTSNTGNGSVSIVNNDPAASKVTVHIFYFDSTGMHNLESGLSQVSAS